MGCFGGWGRLFVGGAENSGSFFAQKKKKKKGCTSQPSPSWQHACAAGLLWRFVVGRQAGREENLRKNK